ncbi:helix-turn-helix domain-containing protein [Gryllotalpicola protaetiae]|uniref:XRE family transcriptional regulator n=1 Tax=Gryllotalpicola protaetiae TaxID=2419771 RepID=A0A387BSD8_9MICO|nr:XRE family transcriptional regulator [Gryllotalpicola protaetiae]AYG04984.1 XRE family transcriptional regulator [Gryllotalpicola protaetiae]
MTTELTRVIDEQALRIGERIRALRRASELTLIQLAERTELSHSFLSQLERGHARPSMVSLERIARALGTSQVELLAAGDPHQHDPDDPRPDIMRAPEGARGPFSQGEARLLVHGASAFAFEPMEWVGANTDPGPYYEHQEDEFVYVLSGRVLLDLQREGISELAPGDSAYYRGGTQHRWCSADGAEFRMIVVKQAPSGVGTRG